LDIVSLIPQFGNVIYTIAAFVIALSVIVAVHEYGHYIVGRWSGIYAEVFSLGFGPVLWSRVDKRGTRWQIALLPFGGFVKFLGDANAASGKDEDAMAEASQNPEELRRTMHGAPLWARTATVAAGPVFNFVLSILVFAAVFSFRGTVSEPLTVGDLIPMPEASVQLQSGDRILEIEGYPMPAYDDIEGRAAFWDQIPAQSPLNYTVERDGQQVTVPGPYLFPPYVMRVSPRSASMDAGLESGDVITAIDGEAIVSFDELKNAVEGSNGRALLLTVWRDGDEVEFTLSPRRRDEPDAEGGFVTHWRIGIVGGMAFEPATESLGPLKALSGGATQTWAVIQGSLSGIWHMVTGAISTCNISGPVGIAQTSGEVASQGVQSFISFIALLSTAVGLLNLFPIPALDGGHLVFYAYEAVTGKPPSDGALRILMAIGLGMILTLMVFSLGNDLLFC
jgi:regulator of sigma E protease